MDREAELESAKADLVEMATQIKTLEQQLSEHTEAVAEAGRRAAAAELRAELTNRGDDDERAETSRQTAIAKLKDDLRTANEQVQGLERELTMAEEARRVSVAKIEAVQERAELQHYHGLEAQRCKWEEHERRLLGCRGGATDRANCWSQLRGGWNC